MQLFKNNAYSTLGATLTSVATTLTVAAGQGDRFPVVTAPDFALVTLQDAANNIEIVKVTARVAGGDSMTIQRAQEGTTARAWAIGDVVELRLTAASLAPLGVLEGDTSAADIRATLDVPTRTGGNASGTWGISISGNAATATAAGTATSLQTARSINGTEFNGSTDITTALWGTARTITIGAAGKSVNGSANVGWTLAEIGAAAADATVNLTGNQAVAGVKTWNGQQVWGSDQIHGYTNVVSTYTGYFTLGNRGFRKVTATNAIEVLNNANTAVTLTLADNGDLTAAGNVTAYSDERLKADWDVAMFWGPEFIQRLAYVTAGTYTRKDTGERQVGVSAQSLRAVIPQAVVEDADGMLSVAYGNAALAACVALAREVVQLRQRIEAMEAR